MRLHLCLHRRHHIGRAQVYFFAGTGAARNQVCVHKFLRGYPQVALFQKGTTGFLKCCRTNTDMRIGVGSS